MAIWGFRYGVSDYILKKPRPFWPGSLYNWHEGDVFGVEIYNEKVASMQKQLFEIVWKLAEKD